MWKKVKIIVFILVILLLVPVAVTVFLYQSDTKAIVKSYVLSETGRNLAIEGRIAAKWGLSPIIYAEQVHLSNSDWAQTPYAFTADKITISLSFIELIRGQLKVTAVELDRPQLWIEQNPETEVFNLDMWSSRGSENQGPLLSERIEIEEIEIRNGSIVYIHEERTWNIEIHSAKLESPENNLPTEIQALGEVENTTLSISGELGSLNSVLAYRETPVELGGYLGDQSNNFSISGVAGDLLSWYGLNLWLDARISNLADFSNLLGFNVPPYRNISVKAELVQPQSAETMRAESIKLSSFDLGLSASAEGQIGNLVDFSEVDIKFKAAGNLDKNLIPVELPPAVNLETSVAGRLTGNKDNLVLELEHGQVLSQGVSFYAAGIVGNVSNNWASPLPVKIQIDSLSSLNELLDVELPSSGEIRVDADLNRFSEDLGLSGINISSTSDTLDINAQGKFANLGANTIGELEFDLRGNSEFLGGISDSDYVGLIEGISADGIFRIENTVASLPVVKIDGAGRGLNLQGSGSVTDLSGLNGLNLDLQLQIESLSILNSVVDQNLPATGQLSLTGKLYADGDSKINLADISGRLDDTDLTIEIAGGAMDITKTPTVNLDFSMGMNSIEPVREMYPQQGLLTNLLLPLLPVKGNFTLTGGPGTKPGYSLQNIVINTLAERIDGQLVGGIQNLGVSEGNQSSGQTSGIDGKLSLHLAGILETPSVGADSLKIIESSILKGNIDGNMDILFNNSEVGLDRVEFKIQAGQSRLQVTGSIDEFEPLQTDGLHLEFEVEALNDLFKSVESPLEWNNPATGVISLTTSEMMKTVELDIQIANSDVKGDIVIISPEAGDKEIAHNSYRANLTSNNFDLSELLVENESTDTFFSMDPVNLDWIGDTKAEILFSTGRFTGINLDLDNFESFITFGKGQLNSRASGQRGQGKVDVNLGLQQLEQGVNTQVRVNGRDVDLSVLTYLEKNVSDNPGIFSIDVEISGTGDSISGILGNASGTALLEFGGAKVKNDGLVILGHDLFMGIFDAINPLSKKNEYLDIECGVVKFDVENGIIKSKHGLALKTTTVTLLGGGEINLGNEKIKVFVRPKARKGLGINTNSIAKLIRIGGTLNKPEIETDTKGLLQTGVALGAVWFTGGLSLLAQGVYDKTRANADVCNIAANRAPVADTGNVGPATLEPGTAK